MNEYASLKNNKKSGSVLWVTIAILIVLEFCALAMLGAQIMSYTSIPKRNYISLTEASDITKLEISEKTAAIRRALSPTAAVVRSVPNAAAVAPVTGLVTAGAITGTGFSVYDKDKVWSTHTDVEIFKISYDNNGDAVFTVNSFNNKDKVIAPGTENTYWFTLKNSGSETLDYTLYVDAYFANTDEIIPVEAKMFDYTGKYLCGSADEWRPVLELDPIEEHNNLGAGKIADYTLQWQWPFERFDGDGLDANDQFDTMLGNLAAKGESLELHIIIRTVAEIDDKPGGGDNPPTQDVGYIPVLVVVAVLALMMIIILAAGRRKAKWA